MRKQHQKKFRVIPKVGPLECVVEEVFLAAHLFLFNEDAQPSHDVRRPSIFQSQQPAPKLVPQRDAETPARLSEHPPRSKASPLTRLKLSVVDQGEPARVPIG